MPQPLNYLKETASQTAGPYVHIGLIPAMAGFDIFEKNFSNVLVTPNTQGERITLEGKVFDGSGTPLRDVLLEIWQANAAGRYDHPADRSGRQALDEDFRGWGRAGSDFDSGAGHVRDHQAGRDHRQGGPQMRAARQRLDRRARHQHRPAHAALFRRRGSRQRRRSRCSTWSSRRCAARR